MNIEQLLQEDSIEWNTPAVAEAIDKYQYNSYVPWMTIRKTDNWKYSKMNVWILIIRVLNMHKHTYYDPNQHMWLFKSSYIQVRQKVF